MLEDAETWAKHLFEAGVPGDRLEECWLRAVNDKTGDFAPTFFDVKTAWHNIRAEENKLREAALAANPIGRCTQRKYHRNPEGDIVAANYWSGQDELMPCPHCRPDDAAKWKTDQIARYGEIKAPHLTPKLAVESILRPAAVEIGRDEAHALRDRFNDLVERLVDDPKSRKNLSVVWDEGGGVFKYPQRADVLFTPDMLRRKIEDYAKALEVRNGQ